jgi:hypothetical protein
MICLGIDPGSDGAWALYGTAIKARKDAPAVPETLMVWDMPVNVVTVGKSQRKRIDIAGVNLLLDEVMMFGAPDRIVIEDVAARPGQSGMFAFGFGVGVIHAILTLRKLRFDTVPSGTWKKAIKVPRDKKEAVVRAEEVFPEHRHLFRNAEKKGGLRPDRAEAALIAYYGATVR